MPREHSNGDGAHQPRHIVFEMFDALVYGGWLKKLHHTELKIVLAILRHLDERGEAWPSIDRICRCTGVHRRHARKALAKLKADGVLPEVRPGGGRKNPTVRRLNLPRLEDVLAGLEKGASDAHVSEGETGALDAHVSDVPEPERGASVDTKGAHPLTQRGALDAPRSTNISTKGSTKAKLMMRKPSSDHQVLIDYFTSKWHNKTGNKYPFQRGKDGDAAKQILDAVDRDVERAKQLVDLYLTDTESFIVANGHMLGLLRSKLPRYLSNGHLQKPINGGNGWQQSAPAPLTKAREFRT